MHIKLGKEVISIWDDEALYYYPEDLVWDRDISTLFIDAFKAGYNYAKNEK